MIPAATIAARPASARMMAAMRAAVFGLIGLASRGPRSIPVSNVLPAPRPEAYDVRRPIRRSLSRAPRPDQRERPGSDREYRRRARGRWWRDALVPDGLVDARQDRRAARPRARDPP